MFPILQRAVIILPGVFSSASLSEWRCGTPAAQVRCGIPAGLCGSLLLTDEVNPEDMGTARDASFLYTGTELDALDGARNYYRWILAHFAPYLGRRVVEVGAGIGNFSEYLLSQPGVSQLVAAEPAANLFPLLQCRFAGNPRVRVERGALEQLAGPAEADSVVFVNVLEHIDNDEEVLRQAHRMLAPGGTLLLIVPALPALFGSLDVEFGHFRRYTRAELGVRLQQAGFHIERLRYFNFPGVITWFLAARVFRRKTIRPSQVWIYDRLVVPWAARLERFWEPPLGQSLIAVARK